MLFDISKKLKIPLKLLMNELPFSDFKEIEKYKQLCREHTYYQEDYEALS